jgi:hypothetical protein
VAVVSSVCNSRSVAIVITMTTTTMATTAATATTVVVMGLLHHRLLRPRVSWMIFAMLSAKPPPVSVLLQL